MSNYNTLIADVGSWLARGDLSAFIPTFVRLGEAVINREVRHWTLIARATTPGNGTRFIDLPARFCEMKRLRILDNPATNPLTSVAPDALDFEGAGSMPEQFTTHEQLEFDAATATTSTFEMLYYRRNNPMDSVTNTTNALIVYAYDVYLYAALAESAPFLKNDERIPVWVGRYAKARDALNAEDKKHGVSGGTRRARQHRGASTP